MSFALITGSSKGIGRAIAFELAKRRRNILLVARDEQALSALALELKQKFHIQVHYLVCDLSATGAAQSVYNWCIENEYPVQYLVNNAGYGLSGNFENYTLEQHSNMMQLNMTTLVEMCYHFLPLLKRHPKGYIMNIASSAAYQAVPYLSLYAATKSFVLQFSRGLHHELAKSNISVTCISPGATDTNFATRANVGEKGLKMADKVNMKPSDVAKIAVNAMFRGKMEVVTGVINKLGKFMAWLLPKSFVEKTSGKIYQ
ncbi:MAG TPA: SDR family oxidoreductase [Flavisolibacter sp.]|nr:SDR family oxidoreductase [Flavisolibacter sp.]